MRTKVRTLMSGVQHTLRNHSINISYCGDVGGTHIIVKVGQ